MSENNNNKNDLIPDSIEDFSNFKLSRSEVINEISSSDTSHHPIIDASDTKEIENQDFVTARKNILEVVDRGSDVLESMISLAKASDHPRAFEVVGNLMKTLVESNKDLLELHEKKAKLNPKIPDQQTNIQNNSLHVGTTAELLELLKNSSAEDNNG